MNERIAELLDAVEILQSRKKEPPRNFSGGMQQRVQISKALANNPEILLLDEVTTGLDLSVQAKSPGTHPENPSGIQYLHHAGLP